MTDLIICDSDEKNLKNVKNDCFNYLFEKNYDADVYGFSDIENARDNINDNNLLVSCFIECGEPIEKLIDNIRNANKDNYVVIMANDIDDIVKYTTPMIRPVGCMFRPASKKHIGHIIDQIENACSKETDNHMITFKIKSKEYYVNCNNVIMIEAANKKIILYTESQEFEFYDSMDRIMNKLPDYFYRTHKSYVVNMKKIIEVDYKSMEIYLEDELVADLSRSNKPGFMERQERFKEDS